jgi:phosphoribosylaminoimidazole-succinocarboxamide synthase
MVKKVTHYHHHHHYMKGRGGGHTGQIITQRKIEIIDRVLRAINAIIRRFHGARNVILLAEVNNANIYNDAIIDTIAQRIYDNIKSWIDVLDENAFRRRLDRVVVDYTVDVNRMSNEIIERINNNRPPASQIPQLLNDDRETRPPTPP